MLNPEEKILKEVPDFCNREEALKWIDKGIKLVEKLTPEMVKEAPIASLEWEEEGKDNLLGYYASLKWRKIVLATFLADLVSYQPSDQVNFDRLLYVMHVFPKGFRTWWMQLPDQSWWPVGYTGWYPMLETAFDLFEKHPEKLKDRMVVPRSSSSYLYLFNYSVAPHLKKTALSSQLIKAYIGDISNQQVKGLACITVSEDGVRMAHSLGMARRGDLVMDGNIEGIFTKRDG